MAGRDERLPPTDHAAVPVPQLIEKYRLQREAWMAQAEELARLRDEVRGSAEREAMEIVTAARRDIRQIVMEARRELFVLSAQVQAALGEGSPGAPQIGPPAIAHDDDRRSVDEDLTAFAQEEWGFAPRSTVAAVLEEARHDIEVLDKDARAVPSAVHISPPVHETPAEHVPASPPPEPTAAPDLHLSLSHSHPVERRDMSWRLVAGFAVLAILIVGATVWMLRGGSSAPDAVSVDAPAAASIPQAEAVPGPAQTPTEVKLSIQAVRPSWIRAVVDGRPDEVGQMLRAGQTYEFTGRTIALRVGDAGAVRVSVNGSEAQTLGRDGQVVNREYTVETPIPSAAPSAPAEPEPRGALDASESPAAAATSSRPEDSLPETSALLPSVDSLAPAPAPEPIASESAPAPAPPPAVERTSSPGPPQQLVVTAAEQWLDAYHRQDQAMLAVLSTPDVVIADERPTGERMPAAAGGIARTLERVNVELAADTAVLTGLMTERALNGGLQRSSPVSLVWVSRDGSWRLSQARLVSQSTLGQIFR
jgi:hypothetical protein